MAWCQSPRRAVTIARRRKAKQSNVQGSNSVPQEQSQGARSPGARPGWPEDASLIVVRESLSALQLGAAENAAAQSKANNVDETL